MTTRRGLPGQDCCQERTSRTGRPWRVGKPRYWNPSRAVRTGQPAKGSRNRTGLSLHLPLYLPILQPIPLSVPPIHPPIHSFPSLCPALFPSLIHSCIHPSPLPLSVCLANYLSIHLFIYLSIPLSNYLSIPLSNYLSIPLSIYLSTSIHLTMSDDQARSDFCSWGKSAQPNFLIANILQPGEF